MKRDMHTNSNMKKYCCQSVISCVLFHHRVFQVIGEFLGEMTNQSINFIILMKCIQDKN